MNASSSYGNNTVAQIPPTMSENKKPDYKSEQEKKANAPKGHVSADASKKRDDDKKKLEKEAQLKKEAKKLH